MKIIRKEDDSLLEFEEINPYPLRDFYSRNHIGAIKISKALNLPTNRVKGYLNGFREIPEWVDKKLRRTALSLSERKKVTYGLFYEEKLFCEGKEDEGD